MASTSPKQNCDLCKKRHVIKQANIWCFECNELLCSDCEQIHKVQAFSENHKPISIEDYLKLPTAVAEIKQKCDRHRIKLDFYCVDHEAASCVKCITDFHKTCSNIKPLSEVTHNVKESFVFVDLHERANDIKEIVENLIDEFPSDKTKITDETNRVIAAIKEQRKAIDQHLDHIVDKLLRAISRQKKDERDKITRTISELEDILDSAKHIYNNLTQAAKHASEVHTYFGISSWNDEIMKCEDELLSLQDNLEHFDGFHVEINPILDIIQNEIEDFATIHSKHKKSVVKPLRKGRQGQNLFMIPKVQSEIKLSMALSFTLPKGEKSIQIFGCCILDSGSMIFADFDNSRLVHVDRKGKFLKDIPLPLLPIDVATVDNDTVAVTSNMDKKLLLVNITNGAVARTVYEGEECYGLCYRDGKFIVSVPNKKFRVIGLDGQILSVIDQVDDALNCCVGNDSLYYAIHDNDTVYCCEMSGQVRWKYKCKKGDYPNNIAVDGQGNVFVSCVKGNKVIFINKKGKKSEVVLTDLVDINTPCAISFNRILSVLLVYNGGDGRCFLFNIN